MIHSKRFIAWRIAQSLMCIVFLVGMLSACDSTTPTSSAAPATPRTEVGHIAESMRSKGVEIVNLRPVPVHGRKPEQLAENQGFDIPGIEVKGVPIATIRIFKDVRYAESDKKLYG